jgi:hypothetical protein
MVGHNFNENTDWFSWAILAFQMMIGIHPYRGNHPDFENLPKDQRLNARMEKNISVFHKDATFPKVCQPFDVIPPTLRGWFVDVFEKGYRGLPPKDFAAVAVAIAAQIKNITGNNKFEIVELQDFGDEIIRVCTTPSTTVVFTKKQIFVGKKGYGLPSKNTKIGFAPKTEKPIAFWIDNGLKAMDVMSQTELQVPATGTALLEYDGRVYVQNNTHIIELIIAEFPTGVKILQKEVGKVMDVLGATQVWDGFILQNMLGKYWGTFFPQSGQSFQLAFPELNDYQIIDAKHQKGIVVVVGKKLLTTKTMQSKGQYDRLTFRLKDDHKTYDTWKAEDVVPSGINFTVADHGIAVLMTEDEHLEAFSINAGSSIKRFEDNVLDADMRLSHRGSKILFHQGKKIYSISMK